MSTEILCCCIYSSSLPVHRLPFVFLTLVEHLTTYVSADNGAFDDLLLLVVFIVFFSHSIVCS